MNADNHSVEDFPQSEDSATVSTASDSSFSLASHWLRDCLTNHRSCNHTADARLVPPTRVIDVGFRDGKLLPRLYLSSSEDLNMKYVALSHCWGEIKAPVLKKHMLRTMILGIDWQRLPKTFQDAMIVTRRLGFRYLWIDSLCIIQDSLADWIKGSGTMQNVYANCVLTIAASWGKDSGKGLFIERKPLNQQPCRIVRNACTGLYVQPNPTEIRKAVYHGNVESLERRAWAIQERFLPPRTLSYRSFELKWDCLESRGSESWPTGLRRRAARVIAQRCWLYKPENTAFRELSRLKAHSRRFNIEYIHEFYGRWNDILTKYTGAQLTYQSDIFVAISGLTESIEKWTGLTNMYGMWKELLPIDVLWIRLGRGSTATRSLLCPTWSWGSLVGTKVSTFYFFAQDIATFCSEENFPAFVKARVISLEPASAVSESNMRLKIQGPMFYTQIVEPNDGHHSVPILEGAGGYCFIDGQAEHTYGENVFCLVIIEGRSRDLVSLRIGLILARPKREREEYVRVGVWRQFAHEEAQKDLISNAEEKTVFLI